MGVNSLPKTVTWQRHGCHLNPGPSAPESSMLTTRLPGHRASSMPIMPPARTHTHTLYWVSEEFLSSTSAQHAQLSAIKTSILHYYSIIISWMAWCPVFSQPTERSTRLKQPCYASGLMCWCRLMCGRWHCLACSTSQRPSIASITIFYRMD